MIGPIDVGITKVELINGPELDSWLSAQNVTNVKVARL